MPARYLIRIDDVHPHMNREKLTDYVTLMSQYGVKPLLGIIPENCDRELDVGPEWPGFWETVAAWSREGKVDIALHGYRHVLHASVAGIIGKRYGVPTRTEFVGLGLDAQRDRLRAGMTILSGHGVATRIFMPPAHSLDRNTVKALLEVGLETVTDGIALFPYRKHGVTWIPQQLWEPVRYPFGVFTVCLHLQDSESYLEEVQALLEDGLCLSVGIILSRHIHFWQKPLNGLYSVYYAARIAILRLFGRWRAA